jgi:hypothetical protein
MRQWAQSNGRDVEESDLTYAPRVFKLEPGPALRRKDGFTALLIPLFNDPIKIILHRPSDSSQEAATWDSKFMLHLPDENLMVETGRVRFIYLLLRLIPRERQ